MREITDSMREIAKKFIVSDWRQRYGLLEPFEIDEEKTAQMAGGVYLKCKCHYPDCPTMKDPNHPWASIRTSKLNGQTQVTCGKCGVKVRSDPRFSELNYQKMKAGDIIGCWELLEEVHDNELKTKMGWSGHSKYYKARCIHCGMIDYKNSDHLKVGDSSCTCQSGSRNEKKIATILTNWLVLFPGRFEFETEYPLGNQRIDCAIKNPITHEPLFFIEYDGEFHDVAEMRPGGLQQTQERDMRKNNAIADLGIPFLRIHHSEQNLINNLWLAQKLLEVLI